MRTVISVFLLVLFTGTAALVTAEEATQSKKIIDPTLAFFVALHACKPGDYQEKNIMASIYGPSMLKHNILGKEILGDCEVDLQTPDGRIMRCTFQQSNLDQLADQHFMTGMLNSTLEDPSLESQRADMIWTGMKEGSCKFPGADN